MVVLQRYKELFETEVQASKPLEVEAATKSIPTKTGTTTETTTSTNTDLLSELLGDTIITSNTNTPTTLTSNSNKTNDSNNTTMDELSEIFGNINDSKKTIYPSDLLNSIDLLKPITVNESVCKDTSETSTSALMNGTDTKKTQGFKELKEIDKLSEEMFKQSLKEEQRLLSFKK